MTPADPKLARLVDELVNTLQVVTLLSEHLQLASAATAQDAVALRRNLTRATEALQTFRADAGLESRR